MLMDSILLTLMHMHSQKFHLRTRKHKEIPLIHGSATENLLLRIKEDILRPFIIIIITIIII